MKIYQGFAIGIVSAVLSVLCPGRSLAAESYVLYKVMDIDHRTDMRVVSATEFKEVEKTLQLEKKYFPEAVRNATKEWREDEMNKGSAFPVARLSPRCFVGSPERFPTQEKADEQLNKYYERDAQKDARQKEKARPKALSDKDRKRDQDGIRAAKLMREKLEELMEAKTKAAEAEEKKALEKKDIENKVDEKQAVDKADAMKAAAKAL